VFPRNGYGTRVAGLGPAGLAPVHAQVSFDWRRRPVLTPESGTTIFPRVSAAVPRVSAEGKARWTVDVESAGWWRVE